MNERPPQIDPADNELQKRVQARREQLERDLQSAPDDSQRAHRIEGKLRDLEQIVGDGLDNASDQVLQQLEDWLASTPSDG